jgi:hypothetical protein
MMMIIVIMTMITQSHQVSTHDSTFAECKPLIK